MQRVVKQLVGGSLLHDEPQVHDHHVISHTADHRQIVADVHDRHAKLSPVDPEQLQDLRLDGDVEAVVGSSAITSRGLQTSDMAIMARWRMPPENWNG